MYKKEASKMVSFRSVDELNGAIRTHIYRNKSDLTPAAIEVLKVLSRHAVKTPGVAYLKLATIAELIGKHRVTVIRSIKRLINLGIIRKEIKYRPYAADTLQEIGLEAVRQTFIATWPAILTAYWIGCWTVYMLQI
ncbi:helix-turn-helix domain-containing protein [Bacillus subtilis]|uniref:Helix-turn-helix domain-containing protein n=2 Tax=Bacillus subtilis TaxID=1423 RepID=A0AC61YZB8_BACIU|nr:hypothetical protein SC09_contig4orf00196 [Bacillus subtilis]MEC0311834.1 helix-turn-helix domain-containing protein [Bacillus subtilis]MEC0360974.1 helix-turn-helix domain-containing protein [Bacillus subtilis]MED3628586.1 helix-turn-helix domain-containing protein [Bacillus subtilis]WEY99623.1 helix-turn-helix domain-containing protein [Bacillus subtilis]